jgi:hypothetical protein
LGDLLNGPASTVIVNTGAFQRVASHAQVYAALVAKRKSNAQAHFQDLLPTDLPDCHTFVRIAPYGDAPVPELKHIAPRTDGTGRAAAGGVCPGN